MPSDIQALLSFITAMFAALDTPITIPFIGTTSPLKLLLFYAFMSWLTWFIAYMAFGGGGGVDDSGSDGVRGRNRGGKVRTPPPKTSRRKGRFKT